MSNLHLRIVMLFMMCFFISSYCGSQVNPNNLINLRDRNSKLNGFNKATLFSIQNSQQRNLVLLNGLEFKLDSIHTIEPVNGMDELSFTSEYIYEDSRDISFVSSRSSDTGILEPWLYIILHYDDSNLLTRQTSNFWNGDYSNTSEEDPHVVRNYNYDNQNRLISIESQNYDDIQAGRISNLQEFLYNESGLIKTTKYSFQRDSLELIDTINYYYNEQNLLETIVSWTLVSDNMWAIKDSIRYIFNDDNSLFKKLGFYWKENTGLFPDYENIYTYNNDGSIDEVTYYNRFDESSSRWKDKTTERYRYHPFNSLKDLLYIDSIPPYGETDFVRRIEFRYDESIDYDQIRWNRTKTQPYYENHMLKEYYDHNGFHLLNERKQYFYSENNSVSVQDTDIENELIQVIPNPARESIKVKSNLKLLNSIFKIYNTQGSEVHSVKIQNDSLIEISHLPQGQYFYKIFFNEKVYSGKLLKL